MSLENTIKERGLSACNILIATLLAEFWNYGFVNQGTLNIITKKIADSLVTYCESKGTDQSLKEVPFSKEFVEKIIDSFIEKLDPFPKPEIIELEKDKKIEIKIETNKCKFCPKGVGQAEIPGTLCMFPSLIRWIIQDHTSEKISNTNIIKEEGRCVFILSKEENKEE